MFIRKIKRVPIFNQDVPKFSPPYTLAEGKGDTLRDGEWKRVGEPPDEFYVLRWDGQEYTYPRMSAERLANNLPPTMETVGPRGLTTHELKWLYKSQAGVCLICGGWFPLEKMAVDHSVRTNVIRGLLCVRCDTGLTMFHDSAPMLAKAIQHLKRKAKDCLLSK